jgi:hypothetical protein
MWLHFGWLLSGLPVAVAARSKVWTVFALSNVGIIGSIPIEGIDVFVYVYSVLALFCM